MTSHQKQTIVELNDIFDELSAENRRLLRELSFANNLRRVFIDVLEKIVDKYDSVIDHEDRQLFQRLTQELRTSAFDASDGNARVEDFIAGNVNDVESTASGCERRVDEEVVVVKEEICASDEQ